MMPELTRCVECAPDPGGPRSPAGALWHETERELPISLHERALSGTVLCYTRAKTRAEEGVA
jgi:hypothetical protein